MDDNDVRRHDMKRTALIATMALCLLSQARVEAKNIDMGQFKITYYCDCEQCSEGYGRHTATMTTAEAGRTIAVDPSVIAYGTQVEIDGNVYVAEDCGGGVKGDHIDVFVDSHSETIANGVDYKQVWIVK